MPACLTASQPTKQEEKEEKKKSTQKYEAHNSSSSPAQPILLPAPTGLANGLIESNGAA